MPDNALDLLALSHKLQICCITEVVENYLVLQLNRDNAFEALLM